MGIPIEEFKKLPHSNLEDIGDRIFPLQPVCDDDGQWHSWWIVGNTLVEANDDNLVEGNYFSNSLRRPEDVKFPFLGHLQKRASWPGIHQKTWGIMSRLHGLSTSLVKLDLFFDTHSSGVHSISSIGRMGATELQYIFFTCRSIFDLLQTIVRTILKDRIKLGNCQELPRSFSYMLIKNRESGELYTCSEIEQKFRIPHELAEMYHKQGKFYAWLKGYREAIVHYGQVLPIVFVAEKGLAVSRLERPFSDMDIWTTSNTCDSNLGSLSSVACYVIGSTVQALEDIFEYLSNRDEFPGDLVPGYDLYTRGEHIARLKDLDEKVKNPW